MIDLITFHSNIELLSILVIVNWVFIGMSIVLTLYSLIFLFYIKDIKLFYYIFYIIVINYLNFTLIGFSDFNKEAFYFVYPVCFVFFILLLVKLLKYYQQRKIKNKKSQYYEYSMIISLLFPFLYLLLWFDDIRNNIFLIFIMQSLSIINIIFLLLVIYKNYNNINQNKETKSSSLLQDLIIKDLLEETFDCFWETDKNGNFKFLSGNIYEKLGYKKSEIEFHRPDDLFAKGAPDELKIQFRTIMNKYKSFKNIEIVSQANNGEFKWFKANAIAKTNDKNEFEGFVGALMDETKSRHKQYEEYVYNNTKSLARVAGSIAHEINNPLAYILLCIDSILCHEHITEIKNNEKVLSNLLEMKKKVLKISKIVSKLQGISLQGTDINKTECKLSEIIHMAIKFCEYELKSMNIRYTLELNNEEDIIFVKKEEIYKSLVNLIHNSIEATENIEYPWIGITLTRDIDGWIVLSVMDNGEGIPFDKRASIFEPFYTTKDFKKIGLGLTQSLQFVERNGGELSLDLNAKHTKFTMRFKTIKKDNI